jgi:hypothetical protein
VIAATGTLGAAAHAWLPLVGGAILAADDRVVAADAIFEARAYGAIAMVRALPDGASAPMILVVADDAAADATGLPRLG